MEVQEVKGDSGVAVGSPITPVKVMKSTPSGSDPAPFQIQMQQYSKETPADSFGVLEIVATALSVIVFICTLPIALFYCIKVVNEYQRAVILRLGRNLAGGARGPGIFFILPCIDEYRVIDLRTATYDVPPQEILTKDSLTVAVDAAMYYRVSSPVIAVTNIANYKESTRLLAATTLRNILGTKNLAEILSETKSISRDMQITLDDATDPWGVKVERVEIKNVRLPIQLQRAMAVEAEASRNARAKMIAAEGEVNASKALREASKVMEGSMGAIHLRYLQTLTSVAADRNQTIIFPLPIEILKNWRNNMMKANAAAAKEDD